MNETLTLADFREPPASVRVKLTRKALAALERPIVGDGGFQRLLRDMKARTDAEGFVWLTPRMLEKVARYAGAYGQGGFQSRLGSVATLRLLEVAREHKEQRP